MSEPINRMEMLATSIEAALIRGERSYMIRGAELDWVVQALRHAVLDAAGILKREAP